MNLITIDGPAGSGKGTIAKQLSQELKLITDFVYY